MKDFKKGGSFGKPQGGNSFGRSSGGRPFNNNRNHDDGFGRSEMYEAICANCGKKCEVPFRPNGQKPVYCRDCFAKMGGGGAPTGGDRFPKRDFNPRPGVKPQFENRSSGGGSDQTVRQLEAVNSKLERLIQAVERFTAANQMKTVEKPKENTKEISAPVSKPKKVSKKKGK